MSASVWGSELWDQTTGLLKYEDNGIAQLERWQRFLLDMSKCHSDTATSQKRLCEKYMPEVKKSSNSSSNVTEFTYQMGFTNFVASFQHMADLHDMLAESLKRQASVEFKGLIEETRKRVKKWKSDRDALAKEMDKQRRLLEEEWRKYVERHREMLRTQDEYEKVDADKTLSRLDVERAANLAKLRRSEFEKAKIAYAAALETFNSYQRQFYSQQLLEWGSHGEALDQDRFQRTKESVSVVHQRAKECLTLLEQCCGEIERAGTTVDFSEDSRLLISNLRSGTAHPSDRLFVDLDTRMNSPASSSVDSIASGSGNSSSGATTGSGPSEYDSIGGPVAGGAQLIIQQQQQERRGSLPSSCGSSSGSAGSAAATGGGGKHPVAVAGGGGKSAITAAGVGGKPSVAAVANSGEPGASGSGGGIFKRMFSKRNKEAENQTRKINDLKEEISKVRKAYDGAVNLHDVYTHNRKLGDPGVVQEKIVSLQSRLNLLEEQLAGYEGTSVETVQTSHGDRVVTLEKTGKGNPGCSDKQSRVAELPEDEPSYEHIDQASLHSGSIQSSEPPAAEDGNNGDSVSTSGVAAAPDLPPAFTDPDVDNGEVKPAAEVTYVLGSCTAIHPYENTDSTDYYLSFDTNEQFYILAPDDGSGWLFVIRLRDHQNGYIPISYVNLAYYPEAVPLSSTSAA